MYIIVLSMMTYIVVLLIDPSYEMVNRICVTSVWPRGRTIYFWILVAGAPDDS